MKNNLIKVITFIKLWGIKKTIFKIFGRKRYEFLNLPPKKNRNVAVIGCGQYAFSTLGSAIFFKKGNIIKRAYDISPKALKSFEKFFSIYQKSKNIDDIKYDRQIDKVYICSSHSTHTEYAIELIKASKNVHIEKPISVNEKQLENLKNTIKNYPKVNVSTGFNRPFSPYIKRLKKLFVNNPQNSLLVNINVFCHELKSDHWYKKKEEGSRISGNYSHWIDLVIHFLRWKNYSSFLKIGITLSNQEHKDENLLITIISEENDMFVMCFSSLIEPILGVTETISVQTNDFSSTINNFKEQIIDFGNKYRVHKSFIKDCGHDEAIMQLFNKKDNKERLKEVICSTDLTLKISNAITNNNLNFNFNMNEFFNSMNT